MQIERNTDKTETDGGGDVWSRSKDHPTRACLVVDTPLSAAVIPRGADVIQVGERFCATRFLRYAERLPELLARVEDSGAQPGLLVPGRIEESLVDRVLAVVESFRGRVSRVTCWDYGAAAQLARNFDVTACAPVNGRADVETLAAATGVARLRPTNLPLRRYLASGFPKVDLEMLVFGHVPVGAGIYCLERAVAPCSSCRPVWWPLRQGDTEYRVDGNTIFSERLTTAHLLRDALRGLPVSSLVINAHGLDVALVEQVLAFYRADGPWPELPESKLCNGIYLSDLADMDSPAVPWDSYWPDLPARLFGI